MDTYSQTIVLLITAGLFHICKTREFRLGLISPFRHPRLGWENNAAAASIAIDRAKQEGLLIGHELSIKWRDDKCNAPGGTRSTIMLHEIDDVDVFIGPPCSGSTTPAGLLAAYWNLPMFSQASSDPSLQDKSVYKTLIRLGPPFNKMGKALVEVFKFYKWDTVAVISKRKVDNRNVFCDYSQRSLEEQFRLSNITISDTVLIDAFLPDVEIVQTLTRIRERARIIVLCTEIPEDRRRILLKAFEIGMADGNYVYILPDHLPASNVATPWIKNEPDDLYAKQAYKSAFQVTVAEMAGPDVESFRDSVTQRMSQPPWNYTTFLRGSEYSAFLHDVVYLYLLVLNETLAQGGDPRNGTDLFQRAIGKTFRGEEKVIRITGNVQVDSNGDREPDYWIWDLAPSGDVYQLSLEASLTSKSAQKLRVLRPVVWETEDGRPPPSTPVCGFSDDLCPSSTMGTQQLALITTFAILATLCLAGLGIFVYRRTRLEHKLQQQLWLVNSADIKLTKTKISGSISQISLWESHASLSQTSSEIGDSQQLFAQVGFYRGTVVAIKNLKRSQNWQINIGREEMLELKAMRELQNENVNAFIGLCTDLRLPCILTAYCPKGSLLDIIENEDIKLDWMFKVSLASDLVHGISYLHGSPLRYHGFLKSSNCVVDNRWVLKVTDFGLVRIRQTKHRDRTLYQEKAGMFWTAPEYIDVFGASTRGDIYAVGVILFEICFRRPPYDTTVLTPSVVIDRIRLRESPPFRPLIMLTEDERNAQETIMLSAMDLMGRCWEDIPEIRPPISHVKKGVQRLCIGKKGNIVDNMVQMLEKYATNLEEIVEHRTSLLMEEKKKTDILLYRMLPASVADRLKTGSAVQPEVFDSVTIYFSDIVEFTKLASESTAMQIVDILNDLYTSFDTIISGYDVYKVETIGDAYMVVSGLPIRNDIRHSCEIADMSLELLTSVSCFRIQNAPDRNLQLRIGVHTGACAAGVVGVIMPRYCLFGDTVNMASRMESTGEAMNIHISQTTKDALYEIGCYVIEPRGQMEIKGKGLQSTYWLMGKELRLYDQVYLD